MNILEVKNLTKDFGNNQGIFNINFKIEQGEIVGFLGANGAGKTTLIRHLMGFLKTNHNVSIFGLDSFTDAKDIQSKVGYVAGEPVFVEHLTGNQFIDLIFKMKNLKDKKHKDELIKYWELKGDVKISSMSKGMKQKVALVIAFMSDAPFIILDEPTSGLDPLMQRKFVKLIKQARAKNQTILMSSHMFEEIELTCDRILMIKEGVIVADENIKDLKTRLGKHYEITYADKHKAQSISQHFESSFIEGAKLDFTTKKDQQEVLKRIMIDEVVDLNIRPETLEEVFMKYYGGGDDE